ncbi:Crp/Fnr family transcriptional regulator [Thiospirochaeta perfilievii]|uniref:Crp/Fnr family transcriptional regulator n=1 Tax=Thiospirochaeta perfilievii TaxID=252967 RepID=A0A5C1QH85_9SPIO|nr:Crp/Fnr family transcriptional regulator [Thiospirochaeta perfilievii]QEN05914.1 Crp/Fnr family transcriptional regulator [Thiospirochaeta perfilievii]
MSYSEFIKCFPKYNFLKPLFDKNLIPYKTWDKGEVICRCNRELDSLYFFTSGRGRAYRGLNNGKEVIYCLYSGKEIAGDVEFLIDTGTTCNIVSSGNLSGFRVKKSIIDEKIYNQLFNLLAKEVAYKFVTNSSSTTIKLGYKLEERVAYYVLYEYVDSVYLMEELAGLLGTTYRHLSRVFKKFNDEELLRLDNKKITILNRRELERLSSVIKEEFYD